MSPHAIKAMQLQSPFVPFRVLTSDGRSFTVPRPDCVLVCHMTTCLPAAFDSRGEVDHLAFVANDHITAVEPLDDADTPFVV